MNVDKNLVNITNSLISLTELAEDMAASSSTPVQGLDLRHLLFELKIISDATKALVDRDLAMARAFSQ